MICRPSIMHTHALFWIFSRLRNNFDTVQLHDAATCRLLVCSCVWAKATLYGHLALAAVGSDRCASDFIDACPGYISAFDRKRSMVKGPFLSGVSLSAFHAISALTAMVCWLSGARLRSCIVTIERLDALTVYEMIFWAWRFCFPSSGASWFDYVHIINVSLDERTERFMLKFNTKR